jgi:hypothetical protein
VKARQQAKYGGNVPEPLEEVELTQNEYLKELLGEG